tara:strand:+ start:1021 stop:1434 length:414 start_codon:yes stop_codon:yes gene_type:complete
MFEEIKSIKTGKKDLLSFGVTIGIILLIIAGYLFHRDNASFQTLIYVASSFIGLGLILPNFLKPLYLLWMIFAIILGWFMTRIILSLLFYLILTPIGLTLRILGKELLNLKKQDSQESYWEYRDSILEQNQDYRKQF